MFIFKRKLMSNGSRIIVEISGSIWFGNGPKTWLSFVKVCFKKPQIQLK